MNAVLIQPFRFAGYDRGTPLDFKVGAGQVIKGQVSPRERFCRFPRRKLTCLFQLAGTRVSLTCALARKGTVDFPSVEALRSTSLILALLELSPFLPSTDMATAASAPFPAAPPSVRRNLRFLAAISCRSQLTPTPPSL